MTSISTTRLLRERSSRLRSAWAGVAALGCLGFCSNAFAAEKPPLAPDTVAPFSTNSRISATMEFGLRELASDIQADIPKRLASIDEQVSCVHRRVLLLKVNANCDIYGYVERSGPVSLYGRGDRVYGSVPIYGALEGQGANRFTSRIHGETEASATIEAEARPQLTRDWSVDLNFSDGFHWSEPPVLHVLGRGNSTFQICRAAHARPACSRSRTGACRSQTAGPSCKGRNRLATCVRARAALRQSSGLAATDAAERRIRRRSGQFAAC